MGNRSDRCQCLAAESHGVDGKQIVIRPQFARGMGCKCKWQFVRRNAEAIVDDADEFAPAVLNLDDNLLRTGVDGIFDQFFHNGRRCSITSPAAMRLTKLCES